MTAKQLILEEFKLFSLKTGGIGSWFSDNTNPIVFERLSTLDKEALSKVQLNQLLLLSHEAGVSYGFFQYYWLEAPLGHPYDVKAIAGYSPKWHENPRFAIGSLQQLKWGLYRLYVDGLLFFGDVRNAYRLLRTKSKMELTTFFESKRCDTAMIRNRGPSLPLVQIPKDDRYLISEMACKSYGANPGAVSDLKNALKESWKQHQLNGGGKISVRKLIDAAVHKTSYADKQYQLTFSAEGILDEDVTSEQELDKKYIGIAELFEKTRSSALKNTKLYLSMINDLDVYVATSMRTRQDFRNMASICENIFSDKRLKEMEIRYFDPTLSAAEGHEDKGLIECLMVKCAKVLVYCAGEKESYGKDAEAAMALSLGKPVIFFCDQNAKSRFYRDIHPLSRLIHFETGVAVGAMVADRFEHVSELLCRLFENKMEYDLEQTHPGYLRLIEKLTRSVVRLQTNDLLLTQTFWNYYHNRPQSST
jgi:hypothetical protein